MKKILPFSLLLLMGMIGCNSGTGSESTATDSTAQMKSIKGDTAHAAMDMGSIEPLPGIPAGAKVFFANLKEGQVVSSPLKIEMGATGIAVDSAGTIRPNSGHFHILIDAEDSIASGIVVPKDSSHLHFGNAQKIATIILTPGRHKLALQFADGIHRSYGSKLSEVIAIEVKK